ncbi:hypothetical protein GGX14DRAFT_99815 [Mycena pura]|uniref:F-box domain-containing protein n=1 Tax=Mycena pura TaxID=153505 RepID=A0AAD6YQY4_9AGAR|nr:hypothetical protein GGX14DRAFT_99815 [Mycena pura]
MSNVQLPEDVWRYIASFIPHKHLVTLLSVNKTFYDIALDARYREIRWDKLDKNMTRSLARLQTPSIAARVRRLHVRAWFIEYLNQKETLTTLASYVAISMQWMARHLGLPSALTTTGKYCTADGILASMTEAVRLMTSVTEYSFEWRDLAPTTGTMCFLATARTAFGVSLRKLSLHAQLSYFSSLLSTVDFDNPEELELFFDYDHNHIGTDNTHILRDTVAPFINQFQRSLNGLKISSASKADVSPLFHALQTFPRLRKFAVLVAFDTAHMSDLGGTVHILRGTLSSVEITRALQGGTVAPGSYNTWARFSAALAADSAILAQVQVLKLPALHGAFDFTRACLQRAADTLTSLYLSDYFMRQHEFAALVQMFAHRPLDARLRSLHIGLSYITIEVFDHLSRHMPGLQKLYLVLLDGLVWQAAFRTAILPDVKPFCQVLSSRLYHDWKLEDLGIWEQRFVDTPISKSGEMKLMENLACRIPSVCMLKGVPLLLAQRKPQGLSAGVEINYEIRTEKFEAAVEC